MDEPFGSLPTPPRPEELFGFRTEAFALVVSGPSGVGKTSICKTVIERDERIKPIVTTTTRPQRKGEEEGVDYHFLSESQFDTLLSEGAFLEHAIVHDSRYGTTKAAFATAIETADIVLLDVDVQGAAAWRDVLADRCVTLFVLPPSLQELRKRLAGRQSEGEASLKVRTNNAQHEMAFAATYDYVIVNHKLVQAIDDVESVLLTERSRPLRQRALLDSLHIE
jgi:guanylate kinase